MNRSVKKVLLITGFLFCCFAGITAGDFYSGKGFEDKKIDLYAPVIKTDDEVECSWLYYPLSVEIQSKFRYYTGMSSYKAYGIGVNEVHPERFAERYDEKERFPDDRTDYTVYSEVTKKDDKYQLLIDVVDSKTLAPQASCLITDIANVTGLLDDAIDKAMLELIPQLGMHLSEVAIFSLSDTSGYSVEEQILLFQKEAEAWKNMQADLSHERGKYLRFSIAPIYQRTVIYNQIMDCEAKEKKATKAAKRLIQQKMLAEIELDYASHRSMEEASQLEELKTLIIEEADRKRDILTAQPQMEEQISRLESIKAACETSLNSYPFIMEWAEDTTVAPFIEWEIGNMRQASLELKGTHTISSLLEPETFTVMPYNQTTMGWDVSISLKIFDDFYDIATDTLSYRDVTGKSLPISDSFCEIYNSLFRQDIPAVYMELDCDIESDDDDHLSCYWITPLEYRIYRTIDGALIKKATLSADDINYQYSPEIYLYKLKMPLDYQIFESEKSTKNRPEETAQTTSR